MILETWYYEVVSIDGDYANLRRTDIDSLELKLVARALLPAEIKEGTKLKYEMMQYEVIDEKQEFTGKQVKTPVLQHWGLILTFFLLFCPMFIDA